ncbi:hypothetical protein OSB04_013982 [Centaurea solstitialis]|uniref:non-specific serine/threonine protein kinase n=1 Tax=Centaurea solstitialis TaxID=347529 RepID=A0AA38TLU1_9ASTR|nr:hypothetical protein OSB04_013982 [Centaurea solstitialis]
MGQSVHIFNLNYRIIYWNHMAQNLYGYSFAEAVGKTAPEVIISPKYSELASLIIHRGAMGESWYGEFPVRNKNGERFTVMTTLNPSRDETGTINGVLCVSTDARAFPGLHSHSQPTFTTHFGGDPQQTSIASKISNLASKVKSKIKIRENIIDHDGRTGDDYYPDDISLFGYKPQSQYRVFSSVHEDFTVGPATDSSEGNGNRPGIHKVLSSKAEAWMGRKGISWPWKRNDECEAVTYDRRIDCDQEQESGPQMSCGASIKVEDEVSETASAGYTNESPRSWFSSCGATTSSSTSTNANSVAKVGNDIDNLDVEILWDDLIIKEQIGQGSCGAVYHALWDGSDVAVKVFPTQEYPSDVIPSFRQEVHLMKKLRHPNILLFMGVVTSPHHLCIVTEFLPRGSLFGLLQQNTTKLDWRRRIHMAMDIARGMNYLHHCHPPIIHLDLKSSNLLVDKNWTVKPQWMAPEVLRNEQANEKSDVYSYGVVLWEITTEKIPWDNLTSTTQVIGAVGLMNQRLEIPEGIDPQWASLIQSCCSSEAESRPTFEEILMKLKDLQKKFGVGVPPITEWPSKRAFHSLHLFLFALEFTYLLLQRLQFHLNGMNVQSLKIPEFLKISLNLVKMEIDTRKKGRPLVNELFKRIQDLEDGHARLKQKMLDLNDKNNTCVKLREREEAQNRAWESFYGYTAAESLGKSIMDLVIEPKDVSMAIHVQQKMIKGETWIGEFPVRNKRGERFLIFGSNKPFHDENGTIIGVICVSSAQYPYQAWRSRSAVGAPERIHPKKHGVDPLQTATASKISDLGEDFTRNPMKISSEIRRGIHKILSGRFFSHWLYDDQVNEYGLQMSSDQPWVHTKFAGHDNKASSFSSKDYEITWEDLMIKEEIGQGSCGTVYHAVWFGSDVALKLFSKQEYSHDLILSFREEVSVMKRLRHPNILLFMGTVISSQRLCIITEFLHRGSLFELLHRNRSSLDWRRRVHMAMDIARGMNYLHHCLPFIVHCNLKSSNLLVDKNWRVKVGGFGLCHMKYENYSTAKKGKGKPEWMAPELFRYGQTDEKSDVYSYGMVLWEMTTAWDGGNSMQLTEAVNQRVNILKDVDPRWASLIKSCLCRFNPNMINLSLV